MIAKHVISKKGTKGFKGLAEYILRANSSKNIDGSSINNCNFGKAELAIKEVLATQERNTASKKDKNYHLVVSFPDNEKPSPEQLSDIEETLCKKLGFEGHQRISATHDNTNNFHLHIAINKINPISLNIVEPFRDFYKIDEACQELEIKHNLKKDNRIDRASEKKRNINEKAGTLEAQRGVESFASYLKKHEAGMKDCLNKSDSCKQLQEGLADYNVYLKKRGAGLVFSSNDDKYYYPASKVDRAFSKGNLEKKLGDLSDLSEKVEVKKEAKAIYQEEPKIGNEDGNRLPGIKKESEGREADLLWESFNKDKHQRSAELKAIQEKYKKEMERLKDVYQEQRKKIKENKSLQGKYKREVYQSAYDSYKKARERVLGESRRERENLKIKKPYTNWQAYLVHKAANGDMDALKRLRYQNKNKQRQFLNTFLSGKDGQEKHQVLPALKTEVDKRGGVHYQVGNTRLTDTGKLVALKEGDYQGVVAGLHLARQQYGDHLSITGDEAFKTAVIQAVIKEDMPVTFADPAMEKSRQMLKKLKKEPEIKEKEAIEAWIEQRNKTREKVKGMSEHVLFKPSHHGEANYQGIRKVGDKVVALYQKEDKLLIKPISEQQAKNLQQYKIGQPLTIKRSGYVEVKRQDKGIER